jgi:competence protein ComGF
MPQGTETLIMKIVYMYIENKTNGILFRFKNRKDNGIWWQLR